MSLGKTPKNPLFLVWFVLQEVMQLSLRSCWLSMEFLSWACLMGRHTALIPLFLHGKSWITSCFCNSEDLTCSDLLGRNCSASESLLSTRKGYTRVCVLLGIRYAFPWRKPKFLWKISMGKLFTVSFQSRFFVVFLRRKKTKTKTKPCCNPNIIVVISVMSLLDERAYCFNSSLE